MHSEKKLIPEQEMGLKKDFEYSISLSSMADAKALFDIAKHRLLSINKWHTYGGLATADFTIVDTQGKSVNRTVIKGDYIKIDIPGPSLKENRHDWVMVADIKHETKEKNNERLFLLLRPCSAPLHLEAAGNTVDHFFDENASSSFILKRERKKLSIAYYGRNETPNIATGKTAENIRNLIVSLAAMLGFSDIQWKNLLKGILSVDENIPH